MMQVGSGVTASNISAFSSANALIIGSEFKVEGNFFYYCLFFCFFKVDGNWEKEIDEERVRKVMEAARQLR